MAHPISKFMMEEENMAKNAMQGAWNTKRKEDERLQKLKQKKQHGAGAQEVKPEEEAAEEAASKST